MISLREGKFFSGTSGLVFEERNKSLFPPAFRYKSRLTYYSSLYNSLEVNSSFYKVPQFKTCRRWSDETGPLFLFTVKIWQGITHTEKFQDADLVRFMSAISGFGNKKGCLLIQYPAKSKVGLREIERLIRNIHNIDPSWRLAVEIRNAAWLTAEFFKLLNTYGATLVIHDKQKVQIANSNILAQFVYLRFHGPDGDYKGSYPIEFLQSQAMQIKQWKGQGVDIYTYFNNTIGEAVQNLKMLNILSDS